jgi:protein SCO1/2
MTLRSIQSIDRAAVAAALVAMTQMVAAAAEAQGHAHHAAQPPAVEAARFSRSTAAYRAPSVELVDSAGRSVALAELLAGEGPVMLQFVFTTCPGVCPALSGLFAAAEDRLDGDAALAAVRLVSISIDPEHDTPERLAEYASRFGAGPRWTFLTGARDDILAVQRAFDADRGSKMRHEPTTYLSAGGGAEWVRLDGFPSPGELVAEARRLVER